MSVEKKKKFSPLLIGSHLSMRAPLYLEGSITEAMHMGAKTFMIYLGAPQNTSRRKISELRIDEFKKLLPIANIGLNHVFVHAPYIVNIANFTKADQAHFSRSFLLKEIKMCEEIGLSTLILHPGNYLKQPINDSLNQLVDTLDYLLSQTIFIKIALETMAGKGTELGTS
jgi:deoxyribonuclease-4